jgi:glutaconate CoA-transferase subunit B
VAGVSAAEAVTPRELMACLLAERLRDGETMIVGGASQVPMAAGLLAQRRHAPDLTLLTGSGAVNPRPRALPPSGGDHEYVRTAEAYFTMEDVFDDTERGRYDVAIFGGIQVDAFGNFNLTRIGAPGEPPKLRGPGFVNAGIATGTGRFMLLVEHHSPRILVERVDFASGAGARRPDGSAYPEGRRGAGPDHLVSPLACLRIGTAGRFEVASLHPGVDPADLREKTGFELCVPDDPPRTEPPDAETVALLRKAVDPTGELRR